MIKCEAMTIDQAAAMIERDFPGANWGVGVCPCGDDDGNYVGSIQHGVTMPGFTVYTIGPEGLRKMEPIEWRVEAHAPTAAGALAKAYAQAVTEGRG